MLAEISVTAQVNTEKFRNPADTSRFGGYTLLDLYMRTGNVDIAEIGLSGRLDLHLQSSMIFLIINSEYGWKNKVQYSDEALLHLRYQYEWLSNIKPEFFLQGDYNKARKLLSRFLAGGGLRFRLVQDGSVAGWYGTSFFKEIEEYDLTARDHHPEHTSVVRWNNYLSVMYTKSGNIEFSGVLYYQPRLNAFNDYRVLNENFLRIILTKRLSLTVTVTLHYDSEPPDEIEKLDTRSRLGFGFKF